jgi:DUF218 domain
MDPPKPQRRCWGLLRRRQLLVPTWRGWLLLAAGLTLVAVLCVREAYPFLAVNDPLPGDVLAVEGWAPDYAMKIALEQFRSGHYRKLYVTGGPLEVGAALREYKTYAELGAAILLKMGLNTNSVQAVPAPAVRRDRTWTAAETLGRWLRERHNLPARLQLITEGPHARRSRLLYEKALGDTVRVGVTAVPVPDYDPRHWWRSSAGFRNVVGEALAYFYARFWFSPAEG